MRLNRNCCFLVVFFFFSAHAGIINCTSCQHLTLFKASNLFVPVFYKVGSVLFEYSKKAFCLCVSCVLKTLRF